MEKIFKIKKPSVTLFSFWWESDTNGVYLRDRYSIDYSATKYLRDMYPQIFDKRYEGLIFKGKYSQKVYGTCEGFYLDGINQNDERNILSRIALTLFLKELRNKKETPITKLAFSYFGNKEELFTSNRAYFSKFGFCITPQEYLNNVRKGYFSQVCKRLNVVKNKADEIFREMVKTYGTDLSIGIIEECVANGARQQLQ